jgi:Spy/CpxP family protein refolding chaperone
MKFGDFNTWPPLDERDKLKAAGRGKSQLFNVAYMTYASEFFSWTAGNVEADTYFCPERHGTYFGGFYMKDMPAMGKRDYDISTSRTGDSGQAFLDEVLAEAQRAHITEILAKQRKAIMETIEVRRAIAQELRKLLAGGTPDRQKLVALGRRYGELDGEMSWLYAIAFAKVNRTLTEAQRASLMKLRDLEGYPSAAAYIYSRPISGKLDLPATDHFFFPPK